MKGQNIYLDLVNAVASKFDYIHCSAYDGQDKEAQFEVDSALLAELEKNYPNVYIKPSYPIKVNIKPLLYH